MVESNTVLVRQLRKGLQELERLQNSEANERSKNKLGRILTIVDAAISDPEQRKATKDLVQSVWYSDGPQLGADMNRSIPAMLFSKLTEGEPLWEEPKSDGSYSHVAKPYNPFDEKLK